jgi:hypothetical protein
MGKTVRFNLISNTIYLVPKDDETRNGDEWIQMAADRARKKRAKRQRNLLNKKNKKAQVEKVE